MYFRSRALALGVTVVALAAGLAGGAATAVAAVAAPALQPYAPVVFRAEHIPGYRGMVLTEGRGLVVYTFTGDQRYMPGTCTGMCAVEWPQLRGFPYVPRGFGLPGQFGMIDGQITYNGWPLYLYAGERPFQNFADSSFPYVQVPRFRY
jgi:predicted lipoprotein with Yx(FWY)xxD motif